MKKLIALLAALTLVCALPVLTACNKDKDDRPVLKVGMECGYQPYNWTQLNDANGAVPIYGKSGQYANGYDVKIAKKIADSLDMKLEVHAYEWDSLIPAVQSGALDLIIAGMSQTEDRLEDIDFSAPYLTSDLVIVVRKDGAYADATCIADFAGATIVAQSATFHDTVIDQIAGVNHGTAMKDFPTMITALNAKTIDGYIAEESGAIADCNGMDAFKYIPLKNNDTGFAISDINNVSIAIGVKKGSELTAKVNAALAEISEDERLNLMREAIAQVPNA